MKVTDDFELTPQIAKDLLARNERNYRTFVKPGRVAPLVDHILGGTWAPNSVIQLDHEGYLIDGAHRCTAVVVAGRSIRVVLIEGVDDAWADAIDTGAPRSLTDVLRHNGETQLTALASTIRVAMLWNPRAARRPMLNAWVSPRAAVAWLAANPDVRETIPLSQALYSAARMPKGVSGAVLFNARRMDPDAADYFVEAVIDTTAPPTSPHAMLRRWSLLRSNGRGSGGGSAGQVFHLAHMLKAWNMAVLGRTGRNLVWRPAQGEAFPTMLDPSEL